ncbi:predicted protein [Chaetomium globosum CBS 148.51]|uniref:Uncharacterized protein n=1 Tax=Chaetomium globosum (strain ATCC 6205 / CBS 148.51 / DSM 1962 / NBRC 6347 / NRRL 1970) TaxID=306901 RepID=Q2GTL9_CHAGB|nr:uncharacterized protein CHGG_08685 [Chaetomium globosum CBS 148.51]EAQ84671.1 predicted protein [Chaetomium globosum CBS 148.51]
MLNFAARASQRILGSQNADATDSQQLSSVSPSSSVSTVSSSGGFEESLGSRSTTEGSSSSEEGQILNSDQQPDEMEQHQEESQNQVGVDQPYEEDQGLKANEDSVSETQIDEDSGSETEAQASAFNRLFDAVQSAEHSGRETPPSIGGSVYREQPPPYSSQPPSSEIVIRGVEDGARTHEGNGEPIPPPLYVPSTLDQELLRVNDADDSHSSNNSLGAIYDTGADDMGSISAYEQVPDDGRASPAQAPSQATSDKLVEEQKDSERPESHPQTHPHASPLDALADRPEDTDQTSTAPAPFSDSPSSTLAQKGNLDISEGDVPAKKEEGSEPPSSPSASLKDFHSHPDPIFVHKSNARDDRFAPFFKGPCQRPNETITDLTIRDQIRRCAELYGRPLTDTEEDVIRKFHRDLDRPRAPEEVSEPTFIHSPGALAKVELSMALDTVSYAGGSNHDLESGMSPSIPPTAYNTEIEDLKDESNRLYYLIEALTSRLGEVEGRVDSDKEQLLTALDKRTANLFRKISEIEACQDEVEKQLRSSQAQLHTACADIAQFQAEKKATQEKLGKLEKELQTVKGQLHNKDKAEDSKSTQEPENRDKVELSREGANELDGPSKIKSDNKSTSELDNKSNNELDNNRKAHTTTGRSCGPDPHLAESTQPSARWFQLTIGFNSSYVVFAMTVLVWLVTEGMLHSKRLSEGYGPFINGGYNGLGSVVIFGTWSKFFLFYAVAVYLGVVSLRTAVN